MVTISMLDEKMNPEWQLCFLSEENLALLKKTLVILQSSCGLKKAYPERMAKPTNLPKQRFLTPPNGFQIFLVACLSPFKTQEKFPLKDIGIQS